MNEKRVGQPDRIILTRMFPCQMNRIMLFFGFVKNFSNFPYFAVLFGTSASL